MDRASTPYLRTKIQPPRRGRGVIPRPRLDAFVELLRVRPLAVVKAPAGYGKTSLALGWAEQLAAAGARVAWLSLEAEDDDDERFLRYVAAAVRQACAAVSDTTPDWMVADYSIPIDRRVEWLIEELRAQPEEIFIFLDDYQSITRPSIHQGVSLLLRRAPENVHLVIFGRVEPAIDLAWLRAHDAVLEIGADELRFDLGETRHLLKKGELTTLPADDVPLLHELTGGWIAALRTTLLTLRIQKNPSSYLRRLPNALGSINTLFTDLLESLPAELVGFMELISITERQCAALAERLTAMPGAQILLDRIERQQLFFGIQEECDRWFAFHPLFRDFLRRRAQTRAQDRLLFAHREAAHWFAGEGLWTEAIHHALAADEIAGALKWIEEHAMETVGAGDLLTLLNWERQLRSHLVESPPRLRLAFAWGLGLAVACDKALSLLDGIEADIVQAPALADAELRRECQALRAVLVMMTGDYELGLRLAEECLAQATRQPWVPNAIRNVIAGAHLHAGRWQSLYATPPVLGDQSRAQGGDRMSQVYRLAIRGVAEFRQGNLDEAARLLEQAIDLGGSVVLRALPAPTLALVRYEQDRIAEAAAINAEHMDVMKRVGPIQGLYFAYQVAARVAHLEGQTARARGLLDEAESIGAARGWRRVEVAMLQEKLLFCLLEGRRTEAGACLRRLQALAAATGTPELERKDFGQVAMLAEARLALAEGHWDLAAARTAALRRDVAGSGRLLDELSIDTAHALALMGAGRGDEAKALFATCCRRADAVRALRSVLDQPVGLAGLIAALRNDPALLRAEPKLAAYLQQLDRSGLDTTRPASASSPIDALSPRERHIVKLMADGKSNKEIARGLGIGPETVKSHVKNIFGKLGVQNRAQAAALFTG